jgi:hypothetical protein
MVDNLDEQTPIPAPVDDAERERAEDAMTDYAERPSYAVRLRVIILLSLLCWALLLGIAWVIA